MLIEAFPEPYYITDRYRGYPSVLGRLSRADPVAVRRLIERRWRAVAPKALVKRLDDRQEGRDPPQPPD